MAYPITTLVGQAVRTALTTAIGDTSVRVWAFGASDDTSDPGRSEQYPDVCVRVRETRQEGYRSVLRDYPIDIIVRTYQPADRHGEQLQSLAQTVSDWIRGAPTFTASGITVHALYMPEAPEDADEERDGGSVWGYRWTGNVKAQKTA
jgi:hypothetical protein